AKLDEDVLVGGVARTAQRLVSRPRLRLAPEGAPRGELALGTDRAVEVGRDQRQQLPRRVVAGLLQRIAPVLRIFVGHVLERGDQQLFLALEMEIDDAARQAGAIGHIGYRGFRVAALGKRIDRRLDHLLTSRLLRGLAPLALAVRLALE